MNANIKRLKNIFEGVIPDIGSKAYENMKAFFEKRGNTPEEKKFIKDCFQKSVRSLEMQSLSHSNFITETTLRHFLNEFNSRAWEHGLRSMPLSFNIMESFFTYRKPCVYFELLEEENYLISLFDFLDFRTSKDFINDKQLIIENISPDIIYNFNVGKDLKEICFNTTDDYKFIISGVSMIRRENEVTVLLITGSNEIETKGKVSLDVEYSNPNKVELLKDFNQRVDGKEQNPIFIDEGKEYAKVLIACIFDLESDTIVARYVAQEYENFFAVSSDQIIGFVDGNGDYRSEHDKRAHELGIERVETFNAIIEVAKTCLFLPHYLNIYEAKLIEETHETELKKRNFNPIKQRKMNDTFGKHSRTKSLYILNVNNKFSPDVIKLREDLFTIENNGYWKPLEMDAVGMDKNGGVIHGKTWVNQKRTWFEAKNEELIIKKEKLKYTGKNSGYIYIARNPLIVSSIFKIGLTRNDTSIRISQLSNTSVPDKYYVAQEWNVYDCVEAEKTIHNLLADQRVDPRREFFDVDYSEAVSIITNVCTKVNEGKIPQ